MEKSEVRELTTASRVSFTWFGVTRTLEKADQARAAQTFDADRDSLRASKRLIPPRLLRPLTTIRGRIRAYWLDHSLPFPSDGVRLMQRADVAGFDAAMREFAHALTVAARDLDAQEIRTDAHRRLGDLYDAADYPDDYGERFSVLWDWPSIEPPTYLFELAPAVYAAEKQRVAAQLDTAIAMAEAAFREEFGGLVQHLCECLTPATDGTRRIFRDSAITNVTEFFDRYRRMSIRSSTELDTMIADLEARISGVAPASLRTDDSLRTSLHADLGIASETLAAQVELEPTRRLRRAA